MLKQRVLKAERSLLYVLGFNLELRHVSQIACDYVKDHYNVFLPPELRKTPGEWAIEIDRRDGDAFMRMDALCDLTWKNSLLRSVSSPLRLLPRFLNLSVSRYFTSGTIIRKGKRAVKDVESGIPFMQETVALPSQAQTWGEKCLFPVGSAKAFQCCKLLL